MKRSREGALVICTGGGIGDVLLATPVLRALAARYGKVVALTAPRHREVLLHAAHVDEVWADGGSVRAQAAQIAHARFEAAIVTWATLRTALLPLCAGIPVRVGQARRWYSPMFTHSVVVRSERGDRTTHWTDILLDYARAIGCEPKGANPEFVVRDDERAALSRILAERGAGARPYAVLHPTRGIAGGSRRWPAERLGDVGRALRSTFDVDVVVTGNDGDRTIAERVAERAGGISLAGTTTLGEFGALAQGARVVVAMDSGPMHVAAAVGAPTRAARTGNH